MGFGGTFHLVTHSLGSLIGLHLRRALGARVRRMTLVDPVVVSVLRECGENDAYAEMEEQYQRFMSLSTDHEAAAHFFVDHWSGAGAWAAMGPRGRAMVASLVPTLRLEMSATQWLHETEARENENEIQVEITSLVRHVAQRDAWSNPEVAAARRRRVLDGVGRRLATARRGSERRGLREVPRGVYRGPRPGPSRCRHL